MKKTLTKFLTCLAALSCATSAFSLTIVPTFDSSITNATNASAITNALWFCIQTFQSNLTDNSTVKILFVSDTNVGLGQSSTWQGPYSYSNYLAALRNSAAGTNDSVALSKIPNTPTDPLVGNSQIKLKLPLARLMGLDSGYGPDGYDSTISFNMTQMSATRPPGADQYDLIGTCEHEMNEVLGWGSNLKNGYPTGPIGPADLFRYTTNLVRTWTTNGDNAYFSVDGTNLLARFNQDTGGDYHDWWSVSSLWAPPGQTPHVQVQDAFGTTGNIQDEGPNELTGLDVVGYTLATSAMPASPTLTIVFGSSNQFTISWPSTYSGYILQERTNLTSGSWSPSLTGSTNPAVITSATAPKFYRLYQPPILVLTTPKAIASQISTNRNLELATHVYDPHKP
jgi:hypothetical protein